MKRPNLYDQPQDIIEKFEAKAYFMLVDIGLIQLADKPIEDLSHVERIYELAEELFDVSRYIYNSQAEDLK